MANPVVHFEIAAKDRKASSKFYSDLFGWTIQHEDQMDYSMTDGEGERGIGGGWRNLSDGEKPSITFYVQVDDLQPFLSKCKDLGGKVLVEPSPIPGVGEFAFLGDPDGNCFGIIKFTGQG
jgi:hypothetical protein